MKCDSYGLASVNCRSHRSCSCSPLSHPFSSPLFPSPSPLLDTHHQDGSSGERPSPSPPHARPGCLLCVCHDEVLAAPRIHRLQLLQGRLIFPPLPLSASCGSRSTWACWWGVLAAVEASCVGGASPVMLTCKAARLVHGGGWLGFGRAHL